MSKIGVCWSERKAARIRLGGLKQHLAEKGFELVPISIDIPFEQQGPFSVIVHKIYSHVSKNEDPDEADVVKRFQKYVHSNPNMKVIDPFDNIRAILNRNHYYKLIFDDKILRSANVLVPNFIKLSSFDMEENLKLLKANNVQLPYICKPLLAQGKASAHQMWLVFSEKGLSDVEFPCVVQSFIRHNATLFKIFALGDKNFVVKRPSLKNLYPADSPTIKLSTSDISKTHSSSPLTRLDEHEKVEPIEVCKDKMSWIARQLKTMFGLELFGVDVVIENDTANYIIIDFNYFPGYDGVSDLSKHFADLITNEALKMDKLQSGDDLLNVSKHQQM